MATERPESSAVGSSVRRPAIDVARVLALAGVVTGHLLMAVVDRDRAGAIRGSNLLLLAPRWAFLAALAPMPVFFAAGGWANATTTPAHAVSRLRTLVGLAATVTAVWSIAVVVATALRGGVGAGVVGQGARLATQPLWFLAAYVPFAYWGGSLARAAVRRPVATVGGCIAGLAALDLARFGWGGPSWPNWIGFYAAWLVPWLLGAWWRDRWERGVINERVVGWATAAVSIMVCALLVRYLGYDVGLIDVREHARSNTNPPTLYTAIAGIAQVGMLLVVARRCDAFGIRFRRFVGRAGTAAVGVYAWHLSALVLCIAVVSIPAFPNPERLTATWWLTRPFWIAAVLGVCGGFVAATAALSSWQRRHASRHAATSGSARRARFGVVLAAVGGGCVGRFGPGTAGRAAVCSALLVGAWWSFRGHASED